MITFQNFGDYYVFSHEPNTRVYLGNNSPNDYLDDILNQQKRSASAWYKEIHTGKEITWKDIMDYKHDGSKPGNGFVWYGEGLHTLDIRDNYTYEGGHTFDFERKITGLATFGNSEGERWATYVKEFRSEAWAYVGGITLEEQKKREAETQARMDEFNRDHPWLVNLHDRLGYHDDEVNSISADQHVINMKAKYGDDVFEKAEAKIDPKIKEMANKFMTENKGLMEDLAKLEDKEKKALE